MQCVADLTGKQDELTCIPRKAAHMVYTTDNSSAHEFPQELDMPVASKLSKDRSADKFSYGSSSCPHKVTVQLLQLMIAGHSLAEYMFKHSLAGCLAFSH